MAFTQTLAIPRKKTEKVDMAGPLNKYLQEQYGKVMADNFQGKVAELQRLRNAIQLSSMDRPSHAKYLQALDAMVVRNWKIGKGDLNLSFKWYDAFKTSKAYSAQDYPLEKASIMWNFGALISEEACKMDRGTSVGLARASNAFQEAAGMFAEAGKEASKLDPTILDLSPDCLSAVELLLLAQAQECEYLKTKTENPGPSDEDTAKLLSELAEQVVIMCTNACNALSSSYLASVKEVKEKWTATLSFKSRLYRIEALRQLAKAQEIEKQIGPQVALLLRAKQDMSELIKVAKSFGKSMEGEMERYQREVDEYHHDANERYRNNFSVKQDVEENISTTLEGEQRVGSRLPPDLKAAGKFSLFAGL
ncbi:BRO1 domain-containing protein [Dunaliella salina]|uniref:BRO1 domain-containing protein n=1 Tax=Dunaliella salina TaxID=3046 RepID=A0ABQ7H4H6_DUNSA|nr:BRO1 domain-containing protein [Dunaliella salina]|eukprot:KAF5841761.1 BRO1 domain-containing protein [Dunaliella salina]